MALNLLRTKTKQLKSIKDLQKQSLNSSQDDYMIGLYNGLELSVAMLENREPVFLDCVREPEVVERTEEIGRTVASGVIRKGVGMS